MIKGELASAIKCGSTLSSSEPFTACYIFISGVCSLLISARRYAPVADQGRGVVAGGQFLCRVHIYSNSAYLFKMNKSYRFCFFPDITNAFSLLIRFIIVPICSKWKNLIFFYITDRQFFLLFKFLIIFVYQLD